MDLDTVLIVNVAMISAMALIMQIVSRTFSDQLWILVHSLIIGTAAAAYIYRWEGAGYLLLVVFLLIVAAPVALVMIGGWLGRTGKPATASRLVRMAVLLHPSASWRSQARLASALAIPEWQGRIEALERFEKRASSDHALAARLYRLRLSHAWRELLATPMPREAGTAALYSVFRITALGQTGRLREMVSWYFTCRDQLDAASMLEEGLLSVLTYSGRYGQVDALFESPALSGRVEGNARSWTTQLARLIAGQEEARASLRMIAESTGDPLRRRQLIECIEAPLADPGDLTGDDQARIDREAAAVLARPAAQPAGRKTPVTWLLLAAIAAGYAWQIAHGDPASVAVAVEAGGMWPPYVLGGQWWRLGTALFLHLGWTHLLLNAVALYFIGAAVERRVGSWRTLAAYIAGGFFSSAFVCWLMVAGYAARAVLVGASGAIMALVGVLACIVAADWRRTRAVRDRSTLAAVGAVLALQTASDFLIAQVSFGAHSSGFAAGFIIGVIFILFRR